MRTKDIFQIFLMALFFADIAYAQQSVPPGQLVPVIFMSDPCPNCLPVQVYDADGNIVTNLGGGGSGTVTSITASSPLTGGKITTSGNIGCTTADASHNGCLTSTDWSTFNGKESALTFTSPLSRSTNTISVLTTLIDNSIMYCADAGSTDDYACSLPAAPSGYVTGASYHFKANTANTGAATVNFNSLGAKAIKKVVGGVTTALADNDIRAGQVVDLVYDGTNMQMQSVLGNSASSTDLQGAFANGKAITGANSFANAALIGDGTDWWAIYKDSTNGLQFNCVIGSTENACDYYRALASGKFFGVKDHSGNVLFSVKDDATVALNLGSDATGDIYYRNSSGNLVRLAKGTQYQTLQGGSSIPTWAALNLAQSSAVTGNLPQTNIAPATLATGTSVSLTAPRQYYVCTGTCTVTPPVPAAGYEFCVLNGDNVTTVITLAALGSSARYEATARTSYGTAGTGTLVSGGAAADKVCIVGLDSTHYLTVSYNGTWTAN